MRPRPSRLVLLGHPVDHSLSPLLQNTALRAARIPLTYEAIDVEPAALESELAALRAAGAAGNVTVPHKERAAALCTRLTPLAETIGAVNTFWTDPDGALVGDNTDRGGFAALVGEVAPELATRVPVRTVVLGAGGAAAAALAVVAEWPGAEVVIHARTFERAERLARRHSVFATATTDPGAALQRASLVINATPVGLSDDAMPVPAEALGPAVVAIDLVYRRGETAWVRAARARGLRAADGLRMLVEQGALAFEQWMGTPAPRGAMRAALTWRE